MFGSSRWLFLRAYLLVAALILVSGWGLDQLLAREASSNVLAQDKIKLKGAFEYLQRELQGFSDTQDRSDPQQVQIGSQVGELLGYPIAINPLSDFAGLEAEYSRLMAGEILVLYDAKDRAVYYRQVGNGLVAVLGPLPLTERNFGWVVPVFYALLALAVFLWIRPLSRDLRLLRQVALNLGNGDLNARIELAKGSWLSPLAEAFNDMTQRIQWLLSSHKELTSAVSHELRTPLSRLKFGLAMLPLKDETAQTQMQYLQQDIDEINTLVTEMLCYAELDEQHLKPKLESVAMHPWLMDFAALHRGQLNAQNISLQVNCLQAVMLVMDVRLIRRALNNLVGNAKRYARENIRIDLSLVDNHWHLGVADDGPGIPDDKKSVVTNAFARLQGRKGDAESGFGLGLAIVQRIAVLHQGQVKIADDPELGGALICIIWPADIGAGEL